MCDIWALAIEKLNVKRDVTAYMNIQSGDTLVLILYCRGRRDVNFLSKVTSAWHGQSGRMSQGGNPTIRVMLYCKILFLSGYEAEAGFMLTLSK